MAASILRRRLQELNEESLEGAALEELLTEAAIALGFVGEAATCGERLAARGRRVGSDPVVARGERALGRALVEQDDGALAISHLERAPAAFGRLEMALEVGRTRLLLARALAEREHEAAVAEARGALAWQRGPTCCSPAGLDRGPRPSARSRAAQCRGSGAP